MSLSGFRRVIVSFIGPYSCLLRRICNAYADCGLLFFMHQVGTSSLLIYMMHGHTYIKINIMSFI